METETISNTTNRIDFETVSVVMDGNRQNVTITSKAANGWTATVPLAELGKVTGLWERGGNHRISRALDAADSGELCFRGSPGKDMEMWFESKTPGSHVTLTEGDMYRLCNFLK